MIYAQKSDLIDRFGLVELTQLTARKNVPPSTPDDVVIDRALGDAAALIDGYLAKAFTLPLASVPAILVKTSAAVARYYLHGKSADKDSPVTRAYGEAVSWLKDVAAGRVQLEDGGVVPPPASGSAGRVSGSPAIFTRDTLRGF